jgi:hypothetical protein
MINARECLQLATLEMVRSTPIKQRLVSAYRRYLASLPEDQLPSDVRESFEQLMRSLRGVKPLRGEDTVTATVRKMSIQEADECAALIVEMFGQMYRAIATSSRPNGVVQLHSVDSAPTDYDEPALIAAN